MDCNYNKSDIGLAYVKFTGKRKLVDSKYT